MKLLPFQKETLPLDLPASKTCAHCNVRKDVSEFYKEKSGRARFICKPCNSLHNQRQRIKHREKRLESDRKRGNGWARSDRSRWKLTDREKHDAHLRRTYKITIDQYESMLAAQNGVCAICQRYCNRKNSKRLCVDHDHATGLIRGILCFQCNVGLGKFGDRIDLLLSAIDYLRSHLSLKCEAA